MKPPLSTPIYENLYKNKSKFLTVQRNTKSLYKLPYLQGATSHEVFVHRNVQRRVINVHLQGRRAENFALAWRAADLRKVTMNKELENKVHKEEVVRLV